MSGVTREIVAEWQGRTYRIVPSNRVLRRIEAEGVSILGMVNDLRAGRIMVSQMAFLQAALLQAGGAKVTEDDMLAALTGPEPQAAFDLAEVLLSGLFPQPAPGKPEAPASPPV